MNNLKIPKGNYTYYKICETCSSLNMDRCNKDRSCFYHKDSQNYYKHHNYSNSIDYQNPPSDEEFLQMINNTKIYIKLLEIVKDHENYNKEDIYEITFKIE